MLKRIWDYLFNPCKHEWEYVQRSKRYSQDVNLRNLPMEIVDIYICKKCLKKKEIEL